MNQILKTIHELNDLGLKIVTTDRQKKNGTLMLFDPQTGSEYGIYKTGYVRRKSASRIYQLNQRPATVIRRYNYNGHKFTHTTKSITLVHDMSEQLNIVLKAVKNYRKYYAENYKK